jgi:hypothetical protein
LPLCFHHAATSSLPLTTRPSSFKRVRPRSSSPPQLETGAGHLEAARHLFSYLSLLLPPNSITAEESSSSNLPSTPHHSQIQFATMFTSSQRIVQGRYHRFSLAVSLPHRCLLHGRPETPP